MVRCYLFEIEIRLEILVDPTIKMTIIITIFFDFGGCEGDARNHFL